MDRGNEKMALSPKDANAKALDAKALHAKTSNTKVSRANISSANISNGKPSSTKISGAKTLNAKTLSANISNGKTSGAKTSSTKTLGAKNLDKKNLNPKASALRDLEPKALDRKTLDRRVLFIGGTDPTGGAGIIRDIETAAHFGVKSSLALSAIVVQNDDAVQNIAWQDPEFFYQQMHIVLCSVPIHCIKIGMIGSKAHAHNIAKILQQYPHIPAILDPVLIASSGGALCALDLLPDLCQFLLPQLYLLTPNLLELDALAKGKICTSPLAYEEAHSFNQAKFLQEKYAIAHILVKGGHREDDLAQDILVSQTKEPQIFSSPRLPYTMRGTGCILASAIACHIALGFDLPTSILKAKNYVYSLMKALKE